MILLLIQRIGLSWAHQQPYADRLLCFHLRPVSILDLFTAILTDYLLSVGLITEDLTPIRRRTEVMRTGWALGNANNLIAPLSASSLDLYDPVVNSMFYEVLKFFAPGFEENLLATTLSNWWYSCSSDAQDQKFEGFINDNDTFELGYI